MGPLLVQTCNLNRDAVVGTNGRTAKQLLYSSLQCLVLPMNTTTAIEHNYAIGRAYDFFFGPGQDVQPADQLVYNGNIYNVKAVQPYEVPLVGYVHALCEQVIS